MEQSALPLWVPVLSALLTPTIAVAAVLIAWQQWITNRNKLKLELFDRRYAYYEAAGELIGRILTSGKATDEVTFEFLMKTRGARFIVGENIAKYFDDELYSRAIELNTLDAELEGVGVGETRTKNVQKQSEIKKWFNAQHKVLDQYFSPLLNLKH
jgi:hypothetical protein